MPARPPTLRPTARRCVALSRARRVWAALALVAACAGSGLAADTDETDWTRERGFWSFQPPRPARLPAVENSRWPLRRLDHFILAGLERRRISPSPEASRRTLVRRLFLDLTGLPPAATEVDRFVNDPAPDAYERLVDRLLASSQFGERFASLWLPLARYAEDQAHQVGEDTSYFYPNAYRYRDWVIRAFNRDLPYDAFIQLQLAADGLNQKEDLAALGFLGLGPKYYNRGRLDVMADEWEDRVDTVSRTFLGLTVACARCHDHKFDPVTMRDYYAMAGVFASTRMVNLAPDGKVVDAKTTADRLPPGTLHVVQDADLQDLAVFKRGNVERKGPVVERRSLRVLSAHEPVPFNKAGSGRQELAASIACRTNPLTARVMVNRVWQACFGRPLVDSPSNFGHSGAIPSHPELLDDLACSFMDHGWSVKSLTRDLVCSATYRQRSDNDPAKARVDGANESLWRMNRRRLAIEQWRDSVLWATGELDALGGRSLEADAPTNFHRTVYARVSRLKLNDLLMQYDYPDANVHAEKRATTTTPLQKLFLLNGRFLVDRASVMARHVAAGPALPDRQRLNTLFRRIYSRPPTEPELQLSLAYLQKPGPDPFPRWAQLAQSLFASNEFWYVD